MDHAQTVNEIFRIFQELDTLLKNGQFEKKDFDFMEAFLETSLEATRKAKKRIEEGRKDD